MRKVKTKRFKSKTNNGIVCNIEVKYETLNDKLVESSILMSKAMLIPIEVGNKYDKMGYQFKREYFDKYYIHKWFTIKLSTLSIIMGFIDSVKND